MGQLLTHPILQIVLIKMKKGFTLVEFLIVIGILSLSVGSIMLILTTVIKGANQTNVTAEVKQNGQNVLDTVSGQIRNASDVYSLNGYTVLFGNVLNKPSGSRSAIWVFTETGEKLTIACVDSVGTTSNGLISVYTGLATDTAPPASVTSSFKPISNTDVLSGVDIDCADTTFALSAPTANVKVVLVDFTVNQAVQAPSRVDFKANAQFKTAISLRLYQ